MAYKDSLYAWTLNSHQLCEYLRKLSSCEHPNLPYTTCTFFILKQITALVPSEGEKWVSILYFHDHIFIKEIRQQLTFLQMSRIIRKQTFCICKNKGTDQLRSNCEDDQRLSFRYMDSTIPVLLKSKISNF